MVANESDAKSDDYEVFEGKLSRRYVRSFFLDFAAKGTFPRKVKYGPMLHWELMSQSYRQWFHIGILMFR